jgi:hypothetical protein
MREGIRSDCLPDVDCLVTWFGPGRGEVCVVCASRILGSDVSVACDLPGGRTVQFHARCYEKWLASRRA